MRVKIRPKWDWNFHADLRDFRVHWVKIRPKWDWNEKEAVNLEKGIMLKSDQNGIEIQEYLEGLDKEVELKSDQNGIEIHRCRMIVLIL